MTVSRWWIYLQRFPTKRTFLVPRVLIPKRVITLASFIRKHISLAVILWDNWNGDFHLLSLWFISFLSVSWLCKSSKEKYFLSLNIHEKMNVFFKEKTLYPLNFTFYLSCGLEKPFWNFFFFTENFYHSNVHALTWDCEGVSKIL